MNEYEYIQRTQELEEPVKTSQQQSAQKMQKPSDTPNVSIGQNKITPFERSLHEAPAKAAEGINMRDMRPDPILDWSADGQKVITTHPDKKDIPLAGGQSLNTPISNNEPLEAAATGVNTNVEAPLMGSAPRLENKKIFAPRNPANPKTGDKDIQLPKINTQTPKKEKSEPNFENKYGIDDRLATNDPDTMAAARQAASPDSGVGTVTEDELLVESHFICYRHPDEKEMLDDEAEKLAGQWTKSIETYWNKPEGTNTIEGKTYKVKFKITYEYVSFERAYFLYQTADDTKINFMCLKSKELSKGALAGNTMILTKQNMELVPAVAAHEYGHLMGWYDETVDIMGKNIKQDFVYRDKSENGGHELDGPELSIMMPLIVNTVTKLPSGKTTQLRTFQSVEYYSKTPIDRKYVKVIEGIEFADPDKIEVTKADVANLFKTPFKSYEYMKRVHKLTEKEVDSTKPTIEKIDEKHYRLCLHSIFLDDSLKQLHGAGALPKDNSNKSIRAYYQDVETAIDVFWALKEAKDE